MNDADKELALAFINEAVQVDKTPFFLYLATTTPHAGFLTGHGVTPPGYATYGWVWG
jgi:hypothetical protein